MADRALSVPCSMFIQADGNHCLSLLSFQATNTTEGFLHFIFNAFSYKSCDFKLLLACIQA